MTLAEEPQGLGNTSTSTGLLSPQGISDLYNFPLAGLDIPTGAIGLIEIGIGQRLEPTAPRPFRTC